MHKKMKKALSCVLAIMLVLGMIPGKILAADAQAENQSELPTSMEGLSIAYPYNTETVQLTGEPVSRFQALTFESARAEVESAQLILSPQFDVTEFSLTMNELQNEKGNVIPAWVFEVYIQHYVTITDSKNNNNYNSSLDMYHPETGTSGLDGTYPDALIPQSTAIAKGENTIQAGNNQGIWVNLNVAGAAPGTYNGTATLTVNGTDMAIPVSVRVYDVQLPDEVHVKSSFGIWWDYVEHAEGYIDHEIATAYYDYLISKRIAPNDGWCIQRYDDAMVNKAVEWTADPKVPSYSLPYAKDSSGYLDVASMKTSLIALIEKNIELAESGSNLDLFKKAYFFFGSICDEPRNDEEYVLTNRITASLDSTLQELAPMLADYPSIQESFLNIKHLVTGPNPTDATYKNKTYGSFWNKKTFVNINYGTTALTGNSYVYVPQYQWLNTKAQRDMYSNEEELWWYGCMHPVAPYPTYDVNTPLIAARIISYMMHEYNISGMLFASVNQWGQYTDNGIAMYDIWNGYSGIAAPGDQILIYPGKDYGILGPIGTIRLENIREGNEDYEYLWLLKNVYGISDISTYTQNMYTGVIANTDPSVHHSNRIALLSKLEQLNVAANGETQIAPGQEGFVRGEFYPANTDVTIQLDETVAAAGVSFEYKVVSGNSFNIALMSDWSNYYGYYAFNETGSAETYKGVSLEALDYGYIRVVMDLSVLTKISGSLGNNIDFLYLRGNWSNCDIYLDNLQLLTELPEEVKPTEPPATEPPKQVFEGGSFTSTRGATFEIDNDQAVTKLSFDYKIDSGENFQIALRSNRTNYYGYYKFNADGMGGVYPGVVAQKLDNGYIRVCVDLTFTTAVVGSPSGVITSLYIPSSWTRVSGSITNICINDAVQISYRGNSVAAGQNMSIPLDKTKILETLSFDYIVTSGQDYSVALCPDWSNYFGYYKFNATGATTSYTGITTENLADGYVRVTFDLDALNVKTNNPTQKIEFIYIRDIYCNISGFVDNIQCTYSCAHSYKAVVTEPSFTAKGYTTYTCVSCGDSYTADETAAYTYEVSQWNITLADDIQAKFYLNVDSRITDATVCVTVGDSTVSKTLKSLNKVDGSYEMMANLSAAQMADDIAVKIIYGDAISAVKNYDIRQYAQHILTGEYDDETKALVQSMLHYGAAAQNYFGYNTDDLANKGYEITVAPVIPEELVVPAAEGAVEGIRFYGASLLFQTKIGVRFYFAVTGDISSYTFSNGAAPVAKDSMYYVDVLNINPDCYDEVIKLSVTDGADTLTVNYSPMHYISRKYYGSHDEKLKALVAALYQYHLTAVDYLTIEPEFTAGTDLTIDLNNAQAVTKLSFDYKLTSDGELQVALLPDWYNYFGYFGFNANGAIDPYNGVTTEKLSNGYIRVHIDMNAVNKISGKPSNVLTMIYIRGIYTTANGKITNICL